MPIAMDNKIVCDYCGTIYNADKSVCPLCGNAPSDEARGRQRSNQRRRMTEAERRQKIRAEHRADVQSREEEDPKRIPRKLAAASAVFFALSVLVVFYFIGDMLGWWPGLGGLLNGDMRATTSSDEDRSKTCTFLEIQPENIDFTQKGQIQKLRVIINAGCEETVSFTSSDDKVINVSTDSQKTETHGEQTSITIEVSALSEGAASIQVGCGSLKRTCHITCDFGGSASESDETDDSSQTTEPTEPSAEAFTPKLNHEDVTLTLPKETVTLKVTNLPDGRTVSWKSSDEKVATVDANGKVTAVSSGTATITADCDGSTAKAIVRCNFSSTVEGGDSGTHLTHTDVTISVGEEFNLRLIDGSGNRINDATYYIKNPEICSLSGVTVRGTAKGTTEITVTYNGKSYTCIIRVG